MPYKSSSDRLTVIKAMGLVAQAASDLADGGNRPEAFASDALWWRLAAFDWDMQGDAEEAAACYLAADRADRRAVLAARIKARAA